LLHPDPGSLKSIIPIIIPPNRISMPSWLFDSKVGHMKLSIKFADTISEVDIDDTATVRQLKKHLSSLHNCTVSQCRLIYEARALRNNAVLSSLSLSPTKPISLVIEVPSGPPDAHFLAAINEPGLARRLNDPVIMDVINHLRTELSELGDSQYLDAVRRLGLIPAYDPHRFDEEEAKYEEGLASLKEMGFMDRKTNLEALRNSQGDPYAAVEWLYQNGKLQ
jgi:hypothetical protein